MSSQRAGWIALVYSSVRSCLILRSSTQHSVTIRLTSRRTTAAGVSAGGSSTVPKWPAPTATERPASAETAGGTPGAADVTDASLVSVVVERATGVVPEHVVERRALPERRLEQSGRPRGPDGSGVHEGDP